MTKPRTFGVIGLGTFGSAVATELSRFDNYVIGIDIADAPVAAMADTRAQHRPRSGIQGDGADGDDGEFLDVAFEVASASGTVGLSRGITGELDGFSRAIIMVIMFFGRVGPLTLGFFLATWVGSRVRYPDGQVYLG